MIIFGSIAFILFTSGVLCFWAKRRLRPEFDCSDWKIYGTDWGTGGTICVVFGVISLLLGIGVVGGIVYNQICDSETIAQLENQKMIYTEQRDVLLSQFKTHLTEQYPEYEKEIFNKLVPASAEVFAVGYPQLKTNETLMLFVDKIDEFNRLIYDTDITKETVLKRMRIRKREWLFSFPSLVPEK